MLASYHHCKSHHWKLHGSKHQMNEEEWRCKGRDIDWRQREDQASKGYQEDVCKEDTTLLNFGGLLFEQIMTSLLVSFVCANYLSCGRGHFTWMTTSRTYLWTFGTFRDFLLMPSHHSDTSCCRRCAQVHRNQVARLGCSPTKTEQKMLCYRCTTKTHTSFHRRFTSSSSTTTQMLTLMLGSQCSLK